ncbi:MAG: helix-turn-helix domain-containing protein [Rhodobacteraceae bacterium]|nr:helix-turn-helix domain-containing protein [Paracoccaceae bacterium]
MSAPVKITNTDRTSKQLKAFSYRCKDRVQARRVRAIAMVIDGHKRGGAAKASGVTIQTIRDWVINYNERGVEGLRDNPRSGRPSHLEAWQKEEIKKWVEVGPDPKKDGLTRWRLSDIVKHVKEEYGVEYSVEGVRKMVRKLGIVSGRKSRSSK